MEFTAIRFKNELAFFLDGKKMTLVDILMILRQDNYRAYYVAVSFIEQLMKNGINDGEYYEGKLVPFAEFKRIH